MKPIKPPYILLIIAWALIIAFVPSPSKAELIYEVGDYYVYVRGEIVENGRFQTEEAAIARAARASLDCRCLAIIQRAVFTDRETGTVAEAVIFSWDIPTEREDGTPVTVQEIAGYSIQYGYAPDTYTGEIVVTGGSTRTVTLNDLQDESVLYARIATITTDNLKGNYSPVLQTNIRI